MKNKHTWTVIRKDRQGVGGESGGVMRRPISISLFKERGRGWRAHFHKSTIAAVPARTATGGKRGHSKHWDTTLQGLNSLEDVVAVKMTFAQETLISVSIHVQIWM